MNGIEIAVTVGGVVAILFGGILIWVLLMARKSASAGIVASAEASAASADARAQREMQVAQTRAAPDDAALDASLRDGTF